MLRFITFLFLAAPLYCEEMTGYVIVVTGDSSHVASVSQFSVFMCSVDSSKAVPFLVSDVAAVSVVLALKQACDKGVKIKVTYDMSVWDHVGTITAIHFLEEK